ncbi:MAG: class I mannose-6-phosphate isomerase, partial [Thermomicrobiales bacterium]
MSRWSPLKLTFHVRTYAFGERLIPERLGKTGVPDGVVAETWEVSDYRDARATIISDPFAGQPFHDLVMAHPEAIVGEGWDGPHFPLLAKFLDASHRLPVHLHADDETARRVHDEPHGKTEAWHILWAAPNATILAGIKPGVSQEELIVAFRAQEYDRVMPRHPIQAGDTVY